MKIDDLNKQTTIAYLVGGRADKPDAADAPGDSAAQKQTGADKVELSNYMPVVPASQTPDGIRASRVQELKTQIANGTYQVPSSAVAEKMVSKFSWN